MTGIHVPIVNNIPIPVFSTNDRMDISIRSENKTMQDEGDVLELYDKNAGSYCQQYSYTRIQHERQNGSLCNLKIRNWNCIKYEKNTGSY